MMVDQAGADTTAIRGNLGAIFVSLELSRKEWLVTSLSPGGVEKMSKHKVAAGALAELLARFSALVRKVQERTGKIYPLVVIQEAGLDGFWLHRALCQEGIESHVVDAASIAVPRRRRRAKTDRIDGECLLRVLMAYKRGEARVCSMVRAPTPEAEDERRLCREHKTLVSERVRHVNRIKGLLFAQGIGDYRPLRRDRWRRLEGLRTGDGRAVPPYLKAQLGRELELLELLLEQIKAVEAERDGLLAKACKPAAKPSAQEMLLRLRGIGADFAANLCAEGLCRSFANRRQLGAYSGLIGTPWQSGSLAREQGISKAGNPRLRTVMVQLAWLWPKHQPDSALTQWYRERVKRGGPYAHKRAIVALARKLLVALWKYVNAGVLIEGAIMKNPT